MQQFSYAKTILLHWGITNEAALLAYLQDKYKTAPLMKIDLGYTYASILHPHKEPLRNDQPDRHWKENTD